MMARLQFRQHGLGAAQDGGGDSRELSHVDAVTAFRAAGGDAVQEDHFVLIFLHQHVVIA